VASATSPTAGQRFAVGARVVIRRKPDLSPPCSRGAEAFPISGAILATMVSAPDVFPSFQRDSGAHLSLPSGGCSIRSPPPLLLRQLLTVFPLYLPTHVFFGPLYLVAEPPWNSPIQEQVVFPDLFPSGRWVGFVSRFPFFP